jgi:hypothetical protein
MIPGWAVGSAMATLDWIGFLMIPLERSGACQPLPKFRVGFVGVGISRAGFAFNPCADKRLTQVPGGGPDAGERGARLRMARDEKKSPGHEILLQAHG